MTLTDVDAYFASNEVKDVDEVNGRVSQIRHMLIIYLIGFETIFPVTILVGIGFIEIKALYVIYTCENIQFN